jgi:hypothetical protein
MWMADFVHDQTIADNVKDMQTRSAAILGKLQDGIDQLMQLDESGGRNKKLGSSTQEQQARQVPCPLSALPIISVLCYAPVAFR